MQFKDPKNPTDTERAIAEKAGAGIGPIMTLLAREGVSMWQLNVAGVRFPYLLNLNNADLRDADLSDADLIGANLFGAKLYRADLIGADLIGANLFGANLTFANLSSANLSDAKLYRADLRFADLSDADLSGAFLRNADLIGTNLSDAKLRHVQNLTQEQLDRACISEGDEPPTLYGAEDPETGKPLVWWGRTCPEYAE